MSFYIDQFVKNISRNDKITFIYGQNQKDMMVNLDFLSHYTTFFKDKNGFLVDHIYEIPFEIPLAIASLEHLHSLFYTLTSQNSMIFKILQAYDYFCIDVNEIYAHISTTSFSETMLLSWTKDAIFLGDVGINLINKFYDEKFFNCNFNSNFMNYSDKDSILFLLKRKWVMTQPLDKEYFLKKANSLEYYLYQCITNYMSKKDCDSDFIEFWNEIHPIFLSKDVLTYFSNQPLSLTVRDQLTDIIHQKFYLFSRYPVIHYSRFYMKEPHLKMDELVMDERVQVMDQKKKWYNARIIEMNEESVTVTFDIFSSRFNETIPKTDMYRFLRYGTLERDHICPCEICIREIFKDEKFINFI